MISTLNKGNVPTWRRSANTWLKVEFPTPKSVVNFDAEYVMSFNAFSQDL